MTDRLWQDVNTLRRAGESDRRAAHGVNADCASEP
jgi:hypothetical protein